MLLFVWPIFPVYTYNDGTLNKTFLMRSTIHHSTLWDIVRCLSSQSREYSLLYRGHQASKSSLTYVLPDTAYISADTLGPSHALILWKTRHLVSLCVPRASRDNSGECSTGFRVVLRVRG
jgi:hypothetical protein